MFLNILILIRIKDWLKNTILFIPLIFSENLINSDHYFNLMLSFFIFSIATSIIYIINDITDLESDKKHLIKMKIKPLANGTISVFFAIRILLFLIFQKVFRKEFTRKDLWGSAEIICPQAYDVSNDFWKDFAIIGFDTSRTEKFLAILFQII